MVGGNIWSWTMALDLWWWWGRRGRGSSTSELDHVGLDAGGVLK